MPEFFRTGMIFGLIVVIITGSFFLSHFFISASAGTEIKSFSPTVPSDSDQDGVVNAQDICPNTLYGEHVNMNGCACSQIPLENNTNACLHIYCNDGLILNEPANYEDPKYTKCPANECKGTVLYRYPRPGHARCEHGEFVPYSCDPEKINNSPLCIRK
jgi:hypothetical protein